MYKGTWLLLGIERARSHDCWLRTVSIMHGPRMMVVRSIPVE